MYRIIVLLFIVFLLSQVYCQTSSLSGRLVDLNSKESIAYGNAILTSKNDSVLLLGAISDDSGLFLIDNISQGIYDLKISFIGYKSIIKNNINISGCDTMLADTYLSPLSENLSEINVEGKRSPITYKIDRKVLDPSSYPNASVALDMLVNVPSVQVDIEGNLTYRGDGNFKVFVNGHPIGNGAEKLKQLSVGKIEKVEIITNPSAKYKAEGTAGIIQVILKKNRLQGFAINSSLKFSTRKSYEWLFSLDKSGKRGGWYIEGQYAFFVWSKYELHQTQNVVHNDSIFKTTNSNNIENAGAMNHIEFGFNYDVTEKDYIDFSFNVQPFKCTNKSTISGNYNESIYFCDHKIGESSYILNSQNNLFYRYLGTTLTYEHAFEKDRSHLFSSYIDFSTYLHPLEQRQIDDKQYPFSSAKLGYESKEFNELFLTTNLSYKNKLQNNASFEVGIESELDHIPKVTSVSGNFDDNGNLTKFPNEHSNQQVDFQQDVYSAYITYVNKIKKFEYQLGVRSELTRRKSDYSYYDEYQIKNTAPASKTFIDIFPTVHTLYEISENHQVGINYSRRISRPDYWDLIPLRQYESPYSYYTGNALVLPSYSNSFGLFYKKNWKQNFIASEIFTRNTQNVRQKYSRTDTLNVLVISPKNIGDSWSTGIEIMTGIDLFSWWNINISSSLYDYSLNVSVDNNSYKETQIKSDNSLKMIFNLKNDFKLNYNIYYISPTITAQSKKDDYFYSNLAISKGFNDNQWQILFAFSNVFNSLKYKSIQKGVGFYIEYEYVIQPYATLRISYNINNQE